ncbi:MULTISPECIES: hypothetical protein [Haloarcula]|jgi:hypothetical protein|uniref:hypothetical protein n=1 Tax=Haloarcula TaxID=2237 RepID=UPI000AC789FE|nr:MULTISPECIES: hypothetical protein [Haloarcula]
MYRTIKAGAGFVFVGTIGVIVEQTILSTSIEVTSGPFSGAIRAVAALPQLSIVAGCAVILASVLTD